MQLIQTTLKLVLISLAVTGFSIKINAQSPTNDSVYKSSVFTPTNSFISM